VIDYSDYDYDYVDTEVQSSQNDVPDFITVTHMVPFATQIPIVNHGPQGHPLHQPKSGGGCCHSPQVDRH